MSEQYRQLTLADSEAYLALMLAAYAPSLALGVHFDAATTTLAKVEQHLQQHGVYGLFVDDELAASVTLRYPWGPLPGPFGLPHIGWFGAHPRFRGQQRGRQMYDWVETHIVRDRLRAPAISLGTAIHHPWLITLYRDWGFTPQHTADLGKGHITLYMKKILDEAAHTRWLARQTP